MAGEEHGSFDAGRCGAVRCLIDRDQCQPDHSLTPSLGHGGLSVVLTRVRTGTGLYEVAGDRSFAVETVFWSAVSHAGYARAGVAAA